MMKFKLHILILFLVIPFLTNHINAQEDVRKQNMDLLTGTWAIDTVYLNLELEGEHLEIYKQRFAKIKDETRFIFQANGNYIKKAGDKEQTGTWNISKSGRLIRIQFDDSDEVSETRIRNITETVMDMEPVKQVDNSRVLLNKIK